MAQTGYSVLSLYYSATATNVPTAGNLVAGELAINTADGKLFYKDSSGVVQTIASKAGALGDVVGPASATDNALARFDLTTGKLIQNSVGILSDAGALSGLTALSTGTLSATGVATFSAGTVSLPAITTTGDTNTGIYFPAADIIAFTEGGVESMRIDSSGNVGIGTSSPNGKLDVRANTNSSLVAYVQNDNTGASAQSIVQINSGGRYANLNANYSGSYFQNAGISLTTIYQDYDTQIFRNNAGTERMRIDSSGNLLVGTTSVINTGKFSLQFTAGNYGFCTKVADSTSNQYHVVFDNGAVCGSIYTNGSVTTYATASDIKLKTNIVNSDLALEKVNNFKVRSFDWKTNNQHEEFGFIAQELYEVFPNAVLVGNDEMPWGIDNSKLVPILFKAIQEQQAMIEQLTTRLNALEGK
jgi:hypothetical protein